MDAIQRRYDCIAVLSILRPQLCIPFSSSMKSTCSPTCAAFPRGGLLQLRFGRAAEFNRPEPVEARVRSDDVAVDPPCFDDLTCASLRFVSWCLLRHSFGWAYHDPTTTQDGLMENALVLTLG